MKQYEIEYTFIGRGFQTVFADNEDQAEDKFYDGDYVFEKDRENQSSFEIFQIDEVKKRVQKKTAKNCDRCGSILTESAELK